MEWFKELEGWAKGLIVGVVLILGIILLFAVLPFKLITAGHRGVVSNMGSVSDRVMGEGLNFKVPFVQTIYEMDVRVKNLEVNSEAASKDLQEIKTHIVINYHLDAAVVNKLYQHVGYGYEQKVIVPAVFESLKHATAQFTASDLIVRRDVVSVAIKDNLREKLAKYYIVLDEVNIKDFNFSKTFSESIELKQKAEQDALKAKNDLDRVRIEADQKIAEARAEAESIRLRSQQITPMMVQMEAIKKWDGVLPNYMLGGGAVPFIDLKR